MSTSITISMLDKISTFGDLLRYLRRRAGITQMELSIAVGYSDAQISRLEQNLRLPDLPTIESRFVSALGVENEPEVVARLLELAANVRREDAPVHGLCPYKGLNYFDEVDADLFVGREALTGKLTETVLSLANQANIAGRAEEERFLAIVGASGSGKSSLVRAGVVPAIRWNPFSANWPIHIVTPTAHPLESLAVSLTQDTASIRTTMGLIDDMAQDPRSLNHFIKNILLNPSGAAHLLLVVDQFEELFVLCRAEEERTAYINNLLTAACALNGPVMLIITLRADFYAACAGYSQLREALARKQAYIGVMSDEELRRAIEEPARRGRWDLEPGLVDGLLHDVGHEPGALPLLSHALLETWQRRRGRTMTLSGYASSGGVRGAIAETAEAVFADQFTEEQQTIARRIFLRLTELGEESVTGDTRRRATYNELVLKPEEEQATQTVLKALADARLITTSKESAEVAHEALIREWPTLRGWLEENREGLRLHRHLTEAAQEWLSSQRETDGLYRGVRLAQAREWAATHADEMNALEGEFLSASAAFAERESNEREEQRLRELNTAQKLADTEKQRAEEQSRAVGQLRQRAFYLAAALIFAVLMIFVALFYGTQARQAASIAHNQQQVAFSRELAAAAISNLEHDPERSILLALQAGSITDEPKPTWTAEAEAALHRALLASRLQLTLRGHTGRVWAVAFGPDCGKPPDLPTQSCTSRLATISDDGTAVVWGRETGKALLTLATHGTHAHPGVAFSPDGERIVTTASEKSATVWDSATGNGLLTLNGHTDWVTDVAFRPDGKQIATASEDRTAILWDAVTGQQQLILRGHKAALWVVAYSPDGKHLASTGEDGIVNIWDTTTGERLLTFTGHELPARDIAFSPDGERLATASEDKTAKLWDALTGQELLTLHGHTDWVSGVAFNPDGTRLATTSFDGKAKVWDPVTGQELFTLAGHTGPLIGVAFSPNCLKNQPYTIAEPCGNQLATTSWDDTARLWSTATNQELVALSTPGVTAGALDLDATRLATGYMDGTLKIWDLSSVLQDAFLGKPTNTSTAKELFTMKGPTAAVNGVNFSPDGTRLAIISEDQVVKLWDIASGSELFAFRGLMGGVLALRFSPDGKRLAATSKEPAMIVWEVATGQVLQKQLLPSWSYAIAFSPDGKTLSAGLNNGMVKVWNSGTGQELLAWQAHTSEVWSVAYNQTGSRLASASQDGTVKVWDLTTGAELLTLSGHTGAVNGIAFSPDGTRLASAGQDGTVKLWDAGNGQELLSLPGQEGGAAGLSFSRDGSKLITASFDGTVRFYLMHKEDLEAFARKRVTRSFTALECQQYLHLPQDQCQEGYGPAPAARQAVAAEGASTPVAATPVGVEAKGKLCELTDTQGINDQMFNQLAYQGVEDSAKQFEWQPVVLESQEEIDYSQNISDLVQSNCDLIVTPAGIYFADLIQAAAESNPQQKFLTFEWPIGGFDPPLDNVWVQFYAVDQAGFLAGYMAASATKTGKVGTFGGMDFPAVTDFMDGFTLGVAYYNEKNGTRVEVIGWDVDQHKGLFIGNFQSTSAGRQIGDQLLDAGVDIILPVAGSASLGTAAAVKERGNAYLIGADSDWVLTYPEYADIMLTSIEKRLDASVVSAVKSIVEGKFTGGVMYGTLENGGVSIAPFHRLDELVSPQVKVDLAQIEEDIITGKIKTKP